MSIEAMKQALEALQHSVPKDTKQAREQFDAIQALRTAIQQAEAQQPATAIACGIPGMAKTTCPYCEQGFAFEHEQPATPEPVAWNSIQIASWIGSQLMHEPSMFERAAVCKFVRSLGRHPTLLKHSPKTHSAPSVPADVVRVPLQVLKDASEALGNFVSDHGWGDADMQAMDNLDAYIARHEANRAAMLAAK